MASHFSTGEQFRHWVLPMPGDLCHFLTVNLRHFQHLESMLECIVKEDLESPNMNERPSSQCTCDAVMGKEAKTH